MCGIAGFCNRPDNWEMNINAMCERMLHRGPDAGGYWSNEDKSVVLGHRRLAIVDLTPSGLQPMHSHSGRYTIVYNGEIYNYKMVSKRLLEDGKVTQFRGTSDTEVLLEAIEAYGIKETISMCKGMFAIALYDHKNDTITLIRDRIGEKPLYYGHVKNNTEKSFVFASDIASMKEIQGFDNPIYKEVLQLYFLHGYIPAPYSIYKDIYKLEPGEILTFDLKHQTIKKETYWSMKEAAKRGEVHPFEGSKEEASYELERRLKESIQGQMMADVPVGAFLSAGIDSSSTVALMQSLSIRKIKTFTIGLWDPAYNEAERAAEIASHLGTEHTQMYITEQDAKDVIPKLADIFGEPFADSSQIPTYLVSKMTREHVTVSLSGDGGDELFCGYGTYSSVTNLWNRIKKIPAPLRKAAGEIILHTPAQKSQSMKTRALLLQAEGVESLYQLSNMEDALTGQIALHPTMIPHAYSDYQPGYMKEAAHNLMLMDLLMYHPDDILAKVDRTAMAVSLETRVPMLDRDVVEFAGQIPLNYQWDQTTGKQVLREILYRYVPKELMEKPKTGFAIPVQKWLLEPGLRAWAEALLDENLIRRQGILNPSTVKTMWEDYTKRGVWRKQIWFILMFQEWMEKNYPSL